MTTLEKLNSQNLIYRIQGIADAVKTGDSSELVISRIRALKKSNLVLLGFKEKDYACVADYRLTGTQFKMTDQTRRLLDWDFSY